MYQLTFKQNRNIKYRCTLPFAALLIARDTAASAAAVSPARSEPGFFLSIKYAGLLGGIESGLLQDLCSATGSPTLIFCTF